MCLHLVSRLGSLIGSIYCVKRSDVVFFCNFVQQCDQTNSFLSYVGFSGQ